MANVGTMEIDEDNDVMPRTDLDSHANMVVIGKHAEILNVSGRTADVSPFSPEYESMKRVPIVDAIIAYDCPYTGKVYLLVCQNALHIESMEHNLIPPFIMREAGIIVNDTPKIHVDDPQEKDHSLWFEGLELRIHLSLWGIFSYFSTRKPTKDELVNVEDVAFLTPQGHAWDPHLDAYAKNEENMLDWE